MIKKLAIAAVLSVLASSAFAADLTGLYVGGDLGSTKVDGIDSKYTSIGGFVGFHVSEHFAVEGAYRRLGSDSYNVSGINVDVRVNQSAVSLVGVAPVEGEFYQVSLFGRVGYNRVSATGSVGGASDTESTSKTFFGLGVGYAFTPRVLGRIEFQRPTSDTHNANISLAYKF